MAEIADKGTDTLLSVGGQVDVGEVVALQALVTADVVGFEDGEREAGKAADVDFVGRKPGGGVDGIVVGRRTCGSSTSQSFCCSFPTMESIWARTWLTRSTPPLVQGW